MQPAYGPQKIMSYFGPQIQSSKRMPVYHSADSLWRSCIALTHTEGGSPSD